MARFETDNPSPDEFRQALGHFATGVAVVTSHSDASGAVGMTANAVSSLSLNPMLVLVCFDNAARTLPVVRESRHFGINFLRKGHGQLSRSFASDSAHTEKFEEISHTLRAEVPILDDALAWIACDLIELIEAGDHTIAIGAVQATGHDPEGEPLVWFRGEYRGVESN